MSFPYLVREESHTKHANRFRWAYCQTQVLKELEFTKLQDIKQVLAELPVTLDETYERILCAINERYRPLALKLLRWITYSKTPLSLKELAEAAIIDPCGEGTVDIDKRRDFKSYINILSGLLSFSNVPTQSDTADVESPNPKINPESKVRLAHFSVKEYLESQRILDGKATDFHLDAAREHRFLAQSCLTYLMHCSNDTTKLSTREDQRAYSLPYYLANTWLSTWEDQRAYSLLYYSANTWYYHSSLQSDGNVGREVRLLTNTAFISSWLLHDDSQVGLPELDVSRAFALDDSRPAPAIYFASRTGLRKLAEVLLARGADVNALGGRYGNPLQAASFEGYKDMVELLLARGADVNASGGHHGSALQAASYGGYTDIVELLLATGADVNASGGEYGSALQSACLTRNKDIIELLLVRGAEVNASGGFYGNALQAAAFNGSIEVVERLLAAGADVNAQGGRYSSALQAAACRRSVEVVERLLTAGADVNAQGGECGNALQAATEHGHEEIADMLLAAGALPMEDD